MNSLDRVFEQGESENIGIIKQEVRQYEKEIKERGAAIVNQERTKAERKSRITEKGLTGLSAIPQVSFSFR